MLKLKNGLGALAVAAVAMTGLTGAATPASAVSSSEVTAQGWDHVATFWTWAECDAVGQTYADGSTGYYCERNRNGTWALYVGP